MPPNVRLIRCSAIIGLFSLITPGFGENSNLWISVKKLSKSPWPINWNKIVMIFIQAGGKPGSIKRYGFYGRIHD
ncbi:hypothetical protein C8J56DRAFT_244638 [Mycena floridula]|nr:hypothetical protein C8J56DRAFT_244638 [Mycena floridula]